MCWIALQILCTSISLPSFAYCKIGIICDMLIFTLIHKSSFAWVYISNENVQRNIKLSACMHFCVCFVHMGIYLIAKHRIGIMQKKLWCKISVLQYVSPTAVLYVCLSICLSTYVCLKVLLHVYPSTNLSLHLFMFSLSDCSVISLIYIKCIQPLISACVKEVAVRKVKEMHE